jgi:hypothetical protein
VNCGGTNPNEQTGIARRIFVLNQPTRLRVDLRGRVERQNSAYDMGTVWVDGEQLLELHGTNEGLGCEMADVEGTATIDLGAGEHEIQLDCDTVDGRYHVGLFYELEMNLQAWALPCTCCGAVVEFVRSAKQSQWALHRESPLLTAGKYIYAPPGTRHCDRWHNFGSRDWTSDERYPWPELGEYDGPTQWANGQAPVPYPAAIPHGSADCLQYGEPAGDLDADLVELGYSRLCWPTLPTAIPVSSRSFLRTLAKVIELHQADDPTAAAELQALLGTTTAVIEYPVSSGLPPGGMIVADPAYTFVVIDGTDTPQTTALAAAYTLGPPTNVGAFSTFPPWFAARVTWQNRIIDAAADPTKPIYFGAYSAGGVVAALLAAAYRVTDPARPIYVTTFGMPVPGDDRIRVALESVMQNNVMNRGDIVPAFASKIGLGWPAIWEISVALVRAWTAWELPTSRSVLEPNGSMVIIDRAWFPLEVALEAAAQIFAGLPVAAVPEHAIAEYHRRLALA